MHGQTLLVYLLVLHKCEAKSCLANGIYVCYGFLKSDVKVGVCYYSSCKMV